MSDDNGNEAFLQALRQSRERTELASNIYAALKSTGSLSRHRLMVFRCERRCALLDIIETPDGTMIGFPRYKTSPASTEEASNEDGRRANTEDGWRRWKERAAFAENVSNPPLSCDHMHNVPVSDESISAHLSSGHAEVIVRRDGTRYAV